MPTLLSTSIAGLATPKRGKVREIYDLGDMLLIVATDRISAFDVVMANGIPEKGRVLNQMSAFWFSKFEGLCANHVISADDADVVAAVPGWTEELRGRCMLARKCEPLPIECVARGYIAGSLYKDYLREGPGVHGLNLPAGLLESDKLPEPIFTPATKATTGHDENLSFEQAVDLVGRDVAETVRDLTLKIYAEAAAYAKTRDILIADTKFEFGFANGELVWIDEALTPDSSRFWPATRYRPGGPQPSYDKQFVRDYLESIHWDKRPPGPMLPADVVAKTSKKYLEAFTLITGRKLIGLEDVTATRT